MTLDKQLSNLIEKLIHNFHIEETEYIKKSELKQLSETQIHYIDLINHLENPTLSQIAKKLKVTKPSVTNHIEKLESQGYVSKTQSDEDKRIHFLDLTEKGKKIALLHDKFHDVFTEKLLQNLDLSKKDQLLQILKNILDK